MISLHTLDTAPHHPRSELVKGTRASRCARCFPVRHDADIAFLPKYEIDDRLWQFSALLAALTNVGSFEVKRIER